MLLLPTLPVFPVSVFMFIILLLYELRLAFFILTEKLVQHALFSPSPFTLSSLFSSPFSPFSPSSLPSS